MSFDDEFEKMKSGKCPFVVGDLVQGRWMSHPGVVEMVYDNGEVRVREDDWCVGTFPWRYYKKVKRFEQKIIFRSHYQNQILFQPD